MKARLYWTFLFVCIAPPVGAQENLLQALHAARAEFPTPMSKAQIGELLNAVAWDGRLLGWRLLGKASGNNCPTPAGALVSCDYLIHEPTLQGFDVLRDEDGAAEPQWNGPSDLSAVIARGERTIVEPTGVSPEPITPNPIPNSGTNVPDLGTDVRAELDALLTELIKQGASLDALKSFIEQQIVALRKEHAEAFEHHEIDDSKPSKVAWWQIVLAVLAAIGGGAGVAK